MLRARRRIPRTPSGYIRWEASSNSVTGASGLGLRGRALRLQIRGRQQLAGPHGERRFAARAPFSAAPAESRREAGRARRGKTAPPTPETRSRPPDRAPASRVSPLVTIMMRHVADHLGGRRHLDDVAEHLVDLRVGVRDLRPAMIVDAERARLLAQIRVLAARHAVHVDLGGAGADVALERHVTVPHLLPVGGDRAQVVAGRAASRAGRSAAPRRSSPDSAARSGRRAHRSRRRRRRRPPRRRRARSRRRCRWCRACGNAPAARSPSFSAFTRASRRARLAQARHVLDGDHVRAHGLQLPAMPQVVVADRICVSRGFDRLPV